MDEIIRAQNLSKHFGKVHAVDGIDLKVRKGEIYGFLGLNGAGKTTTIRMLLGMIRPTSGQAMIGNENVLNLRSISWNRVGYLVEIPYAYPDLTVAENLEIIRRLRLLPDRGIIDQVMDRLGIGQYRDRNARELSLGNAQRLGLAKAIIHNPEILILDEPANGLDPAGIVEIREFLKDLASSHGVTILISSHILGEVARFASRIGIIHEGRMVQELDAGELEGFLHRSLLVDVTDREGTKSKLINEGYSVTDAGNGVLKISGKNSISHPDLVNKMLVEAGFPPSMVKVEVEDLESYFLRVIGIKGNSL
ncbi:MAG TPA: ABC transporter ATP-binding protein [Cyclobacteriaceae bacterium]|nr:ABC transporter ATP-binding protein [Cyclobacteriaceae bacterium]